MMYTINQLAKLAGVTTRTLRYYDEIGLLTPAAIRSNGYRVYGQKEVGRLQHILFYRELGVPLNEIEKILTAPHFDELSALQSHLSGLVEKKKQLERLIENVEKTIGAMKGENAMSDQEKFDGFLQKMVVDNEEQYGKEIREKYGDEQVDRANAQLLNKSEADYASFEQLTETLNETLKQAAANGDPGSELAQKACELHKKWLCFHWSEYSKEAHIGVTQMYVDDERFTAYYDNIAPGSAAFLRDAVAIYCR